MMKTVAIVAARGGSVRLRRKALRPFAGSSLVAHKVTQLRVCPEIDAVYVNTDDGDVAAAAAEAGALLLEGRDYQMDAREMIRHSCRQVEAETLVVWAHPTNPLVRPSTYESALTAYRMGLSVGFDSLLSVTPQRRHAWWHGRPLN